MLISPHRPLGLLGEMQDISFNYSRRYVVVKEFAAGQPGESYDMTAARHGLRWRHAEPLLFAEAQKYRAGPEQLSGLVFGLTVYLNNVPTIQTTSHRE